jgi:hypothetical protein
MIFNLQKCYPVMLYRAVCRNCGFVLTEGANKSIVTNAAESKTCRDCKSKKWKITEREHGSDVIDTTDTPSNDDDEIENQSSLDDYGD